MGEDVRHTTSSFAVSDPYVHSLRIDRHDRHQQGLRFEFSVFTAPWEVWGGTGSYEEGEVGDPGSGVAFCIAFACVEYRW